MKKKKTGPFYVCVICNRCLYFSNVIKFDLEKYDREFVNKLNTNVTSFDGNYYICKTCYTHTRKLKVPVQAVFNGLIIEKTAKKLDCLNTLELPLISKRLLFKKIVIMPKGQTPKMYDSITNVPVNVSETYNQLPRERNCEEAILVELKRKIAFKGHVYFEPVRPQRVRAALEFLQKVNPLYQDVLISNANINPDLLSIGKKLLQSEIDFEIESDDKLETTSNPLNTHRHATDESLVIENENQLEIAPGQDKGTRHILFDKKCEELAFPKIFFRGNFGYTFPREHHLTPTRYFNQRLLNFSQTFASYSDYIFFAQPVLQQKNLNDQINIAMKKVTGQLTAGMFANYGESVKGFASNDQGFLFMNQIKGTPAYWKKFQRNVLAMVKQLDCPTFF